METTLIHPVTQMPRKWRFADRPTLARSDAPPAQPAPSALPAALRRMIQPAAQYRWLGLPIASYTPDLVETIIRGALMGNIVYAWQMYDLMEATWPRLQKNLQEIKEEVASLPWTIQAWSPRGEKPSVTAQQRARDLDISIWSMRPQAESDECDFRGMLREILDAWSKGIAVVELLWQADPAQMLIMPRAAQWVHPQNYGYGPDGSKLMLDLGPASPGSGAVALTGQTSQTSPTGLTGWQPFPPDKFLIGIAKGKSGHPAGGAMLRALAWWWSAANFTGEWFLNFAQIFGMPLRYATYDMNRPDLAGSIMDMLANMGSAGYGAFPAGTVIELKEASGKATDNPQVAILDRADKMCDLLVLGQTLTSDVGDKGVRGAAQVHRGVLQGRKKAAADWVASVLNSQFCPAFCRLNYGDDRECPQFLVDIIEEQSALEMVQRDVLLLNAGVPIPKEFAYNRWGIPMPEQGEEVITKPVMGPTDPTGQTGQTDPTNPTDRTDEMQAKDASGQLADKILEDLGQVQARWLGGLKPMFRRLIQAAQSNSVSDADFVRAVERAKRDFPEIFGGLDVPSLARAMEAAMGAACVNGAVKGFLGRRGSSERGSGGVGE